MPDQSEKIEVENVNTPGKTTRLDRAKYMAMHDALMAVLPSEAPGLKVAEAKAALLPSLSQEHFPEGKTAGWWLKAVQLDLEAKGRVKRADSAPVRLWKVAT